MFFNDLDIELKENMFHLTHDNKPILSANGKSVIKHQSQELVEFIRNDLERCGKLEINKGKLNFDFQFCAYAIFSDQKEILENDKEFKVWEEAIKVSPIYDYSLIQIYNGPPYEMEQLSRLMPAREVFALKFTKKRLDELTDYVWGVYYNQNYGDDSVGTFINDEEFIKTDLSKLIFNFFDILSPEKKSAVMGLFNMIGRKSFLLPLGLISEWYDLSTYTSAVLGLADNFYVYHQEDDQFDNKLYQDFYNEIQKNGNIALIYSRLEDKVEKDIRGGETKVLEFKETFCLDVKKQTKEKWIEFSVLKTIAGFLNSEGGKLLIGVNDQKQILGVDKEIAKLFKSKDKLLLHLKNILKSNFGEKVYTYLNSSFHLIRNKEIFIIECKKSNEPIWLNGNEFYVRTNPATDKLDGPNLVSYIKERFNE